VHTATVTVSDPAFLSLFTNAGFVLIDDPENTNRYVKLVRY
jgi:hypothetical protein